MSTCTTFAGCIGITFSIFARALRNISFLASVRFTTVDLNVRETRIVLVAAELHGMLEEGAIMSVLQNFSRTALAGSLLVGILGQAEAGWGPFGRKNCESCSQCAVEQPKEKKKSAISADDPPRAAVVDLVAARITNERAERPAAPAPVAPAPAAVPPAPVPAACTPDNSAAAADTARVLRIEQDLHNLRLQIQALTLILKEKN